MECLYTCLIQEVWRAAAGHQQPSLQREVWMLGISECCALPPQHPWGRSGGQVHSKEKHPSSPPPPPSPPRSHVSCKEMSGRKDFSASLHLLLREMTSLMGNFWLPWDFLRRQPGHMTLAFWVFSPWYDNLSGRFRQGESLTCGKGGCGIVSNPFGYRFKAELQISNKTDF